MATPIVRKYILDGEFDKLKSCVGNRESGSQSAADFLNQFLKENV